MKRKAEGTSQPPSKPATKSPADPPTKRLKGSKPDSKSKSHVNSTSPKPAPKPAIPQEEKAFPRGGASVLTPLEHKQIHNEATRDVLFEQSGAKRRAASDSVDEHDENVNPTTHKVSKRRKKKTPISESKESSEAKKSRIENLSYKRLVPGTLVLGQVVQVTSRDVALALPNNLTGYVPITAISDQLNRRIEGLLAEDADGDAESDDDHHFQDVNLKSMFQVGQYLRASVTTSGTEGSASGKKRIELSLNPSYANAGISTSELLPNTLIQASVVSIEDHGLIMHLGLEDAKITGFLAAKAMGDLKLTEAQEGSVLLCMLLKANTDDRVIKLSSDIAKMGNAKKYFISSSTSVRAFPPGTAIELLISEASESGISGKIIGMVDATADVVHIGLDPHRHVSKRFPLGSKVKGRVLFRFPEDTSQPLGISLLPHLLHFTSGSSAGNHNLNPTSATPLSSIVKDARVVKVEPKIGLFLDFGGQAPGFAHISRVSNEKIESLSPDSGPYKLGSQHPGRIIGYNPIDNLFILSLEQKVLDQPFLRVEDVPVGQIVKGTIEKLVLNAQGIGGVLIKLADGVSGLAPALHLSDVHLQHPEKKFREGLAVKARVLSTDPERRLIRLTLKKTLINSDVDPWTSYDKIEVGAQSPATLINILPNGAVVQFYGSIRGFLPVSEMSEAYIKDPREHFKAGQVINVRVLDIDAENGKMTVSCKDPGGIGPDQLKMFDQLKVGELVRGTISEVASDMVVLELEGALKARLALQHLTDGSKHKNESTIKKLRIGQNLGDLVILKKLDKWHSVVVSQKSSLVKAARAGKLCMSIENFEKGAEVAGFVRNITEKWIFVEFAGDNVALLPSQFVKEEARHQPGFGYEIGQSISGWVLSVDSDNRKVILTQKGQPNLTNGTGSLAHQELVNAVDDQLATSADLSLGKKTTIRVLGVKQLQLNVELADKVHGRIDASELFNSWDEIKDWKRPLCNFKKNQKIPVRLIGLHDVKTSRFLPFSHRRSNAVFELSAKLMDSGDSSYILTMEKVKVGETYIGIVAKHNDGFLQVKLSPSVTGRLTFMELSDDVSKLKDVQKNFPLGAAMRVTAKQVDVEANKLDLAAKDSSEQSMKVTDLVQGAILTGRVTKASDHGVLVHLGGSVIGMISLTDLADDYSQAKPELCSRNDMIKVKVVEVDSANKKVFLSARPSQILSSSLPVEDRRIASISQVKVNDVIRGFVKNVADKGVFVSIGPNIAAFVHISDLSDAFIKDWKSIYTVDQLVKGKVINVDPDSGKLQMTLKPSMLDKDYVAPITFDKLEKGQVYTGKIRKVEDFGVFIVLDNSKNVSGLCHRSEIADRKIADVSKLYEVGDVVKTVVLKVELDKRRVNFGLKASYFGKSDEDEVEDSDSDGSVFSALSGADAAEDQTENDNTESDGAMQGDLNGMSVDGTENTATKPVKGLVTGGFDWSGGLDQEKTIARDDSDSDARSVKKKKKKKKPEIQVDKTGEMDKYGPQAVADFERLLLGDSNSSSVWIQYMAFQLGLGEVDKARSIAERALKIINMREEDEKLNVWIALLNLENTYGSEESVDETFKRACSYNDKQEMHERLVSIYIESGKHERAEDLFQRMTHMKEITSQISFWINYPTFLLTTRNKADSARALLMRAMQSVDESNHRSLTAKFGALEFTSPNGDKERGRTVFEGLLSTWPKRTDLWDMYIDLERSHGGDDNVRQLYGRMSKTKMKKRRARFVFKKWLEFEEAAGKPADAERVKALAIEYVKKLQETDEEE